MRTIERNASLLTLALVFNLLHATPVPAYYGVKLSWDRAGTVTNLTHMPALPGSNPRVPLYLLFEGMPDVDSIMVHLAWTNADCYTIAPASAETGCGWITPAPSVSGEKVFATTIVFPPGASKTCVVASVTSRCAGLDPLSQPSDICADVFVFKRNFMNTFHLKGVTIIGGLLECGCPICLGGIPSGPVPTPIDSLLANSSAPGSGASVRNLALAFDPNPTKGAGVLTFSVPQRTRINIDIFDVSGRRVRSLVSSHHSNGTHRIDWDGRGDDANPVAAGMYFARIRAEGIGTTSHAIVVR